MALTLTTIALAVWLLGLPLLYRGMRSLAQLRDQPAITEGLPKLSVIIAARDEVAGIEAALHSVLSLDYPDFEVIVVDDRSTDGTSAVLTRMAEQQPRLRVLRITELPEGWLGKNNALQQGAALARGQLLLFTDADIVFEPSALRRAVGFLQRTGLDHLASTPDVHMRGYWARALFGFFSMAFLIFTRPWYARDPQRREAIGIGAFNLVRTDAYHRIGGHTRIRLRPDDDLKLGQALKQAGCRQDLILGNECLSVEWYPDLRSMVRGLEKNSFAALNYSTPLLLAGQIVQQVLNVWPWLALFLTSGLLWWLNAVVCLLTLLAWAIQQPAGPRNLKYAILHPVLSLLFGYVVTRACVLTLLRGGIYWRETFYSLALLRAGAVEGD